MYPPVSTSDPNAVAAEVQRAYLEMYPAGNREFVLQAFRWATDFFTGNYSNYQEVDACYHDLEHTMQGALCMVRLLLGRHRAGAEPKIERKFFELAVLAILMHDAGYLKNRDDTDGTGAKYTITHVSRSAEFAAVFLREKGYTEDQISAVQNMIGCTGINTAPSSIPFHAEQEKIAGFALASGDILGQMAADDYVDKLPTLYSEFAEAAEYTGNHTHFIASFKSAADLLEKTPSFWDNLIRKKLDNDFGGVYRYLSDPYPAGPNYYVDKIEASIERLKSGQLSARE